MKTLMLHVLAITLIATFLSCSTTKKASTQAQPEGMGQSTDKLFAQMDKNNDGVLAKSEVIGPLANDFAKIDTNKDGFITKEELAKAPKPNGPSQGQGGQHGPPPNGNK